MKKFNLFAIIVLVLSTLLSGCSAKKEELRVYKVGVTGTDFEVWEDVSQRLEKNGIKLEIISFSDYVKPNQALAENEIDLNAFQTVNYFENFITNHKLDLSILGYSIVAPMGVYSEKITDLSQVGDKITVAIPNDESNGGRAIRFLELLGYIKVNPDAGLSPNLLDVTEHLTDITIIEMVATQIPRSLADVDFAIINNGVAYEAGLTIADDAIIYEDYTEPHMINYWNVVCCRAEDLEKVDYKTIIAEYNSDATRQKLIDKFGGQQIPVF